MYLSPDLTLQEHLKKWSHVLIWIVISISILVLTGWQLDIEILKRPLSNLAAMNPTSAFLFILLSISFLLFISKNKIASKITGADILALFILLISSLKILSFIFNVNIPVDTFLFHDKLIENVNFRNTMAPNTAICFFLSSISLLFINSKFSTKRPVSLYIALITGFLSLLSIIGYLYQVPSFYGVLQYIPMAIHTAVCFLFFSAAILFANPDKGFMTEFTNKFAGSITAHLLIPVSIIVPVLIGYLRLWGAWEGIYSNEFGAAINVLSMMVIFLILIRYNTSLLNKRDILRTEAEEKSIELNKKLELLVNERTTELRNKTSELKNTLDRLTDGFISLDKDFRYIFANKKIEEITGISPDALIGKNVWDVFPDAVGSETYNAINEAMKTQHYVCTTDYYEPLNFWQENHIYPSPEGISVFVRDISAQRRAEKDLKTLNEELEKRVDQRTRELELVNQELESFSYSISHDLRAPLRAINGYTLILREDYSQYLDSEGIRLLGVVTANAKRMGNLIDDLLAFSRLGRKEISKDDISMNNLVEKVIDSLKHNYSHKNIDIKVGKLPDVPGDFSMIMQVWSNLIDNAFKYSSKNQNIKIEINAVQKDDEAIYSIKDNGAGFDMQYTDKLFGVFQRLHREDEFAGTGVGLALVKKIIIKHGGRIKAEAKVNEGAKFTFTLPKN